MHPQDSLRKQRGDGELQDKKVNELKQELERAITAREDKLSKVDLPPIDVTAPMDINAPQPDLLPSERGTIHPLSAEIDCISDIFNRMGFVTEG